MNEQVEALLRTLPRKIKIGAYDWRVEINEGTSENYGQAVYDRNELHLWPEMFLGPAQTVGIVIHELLHAVIDDRDLMPDFRRILANQEEALVTGLEIGLITLLRDNPKLLTWIKRGLKNG